MKKTTNLICVMVLSLFVLSGFSFSHHKDKQCPGGMYSGKTCPAHNQCPIAAKFMMKAYFLMENQADLGLTDDQIKNIKDLQLQMEKDSIRQSADMQTFMLDLQSKMMADKVDLDSANALIDKQSAAMSAAAKSNLEAYAKLKGLLSADQITKMKAIHARMEKKEHEEGEEK